MLKLSVNNCHIADILGFQEALFTLSAVSPSSDSAAAVQGLEGKQSLEVAFFCFGDKHVCSLLREELNSFLSQRVAAWCSFLFSQMDSNSDKRRYESWMAK